MREGGATEEGMRGSEGGRSKGGRNEGRVREGGAREEGRSAGGRGRSEGGDQRRVYIPTSLCA